ncbi:energy transducer TonB [Lysobacter xanthus]
MRRLLLCCGFLVATQAVAGEPATDAPRVAAPAELASYWTPVSVPTPVPYPADLAARGVTGCVTLAYVIEPDGSTSGFRTLDAAASSRSPLAKRQAIEAFAQASAAAVSTWRFTPVADAARTLTATTVEFDGKGSAAGRQCQAGDVARALGKGKQWSSILRDLYETRWRLNTGQNERPLPQPADRYTR